MCKDYFHKHRRARLAKETIFTARGKRLWQRIAGARCSGSKRASHFRVVRQSRTTAEKQAKHHEPKDSRKKTLPAAQLWRILTAFALEPQHRFYASNGAKPAVVLALRAFSFQRGIPARTHLAGSTPALQESLQAACEVTAHKNAALAMAGGWWGKTSLGRSGKNKTT